MKTNVIKNFIIYNSVQEFPKEWDCIAQKNIFLTTSYLLVLEKSAPKNMTCHFIGFFKNNELVAICVTQFLNLNLVNPFGKKETILKTLAINFLLKNYCSHILFVGNNMLTGQNAFAKLETITTNELFENLKHAVEDLKLKFKATKINIHLTVFKDFDLQTSVKISPFLKDYYKFSTQPNMIFTIPKNWKKEDDYVTALLKKYRDQYKRAKKKMEGVEKHKLTLEDIKKENEIIYNLYHHVVLNASFNTFFLERNHFYELKKSLGEHFLFYGYFIKGKMIGFNTLIKNKEAMDTYFLGYDDVFQRDKMLYLNMLYDMIAYSIKKRFCTIIFARTALEIKSSVGANPVEMVGFIKHSNPFINKVIRQLFNYFEPKTKWNKRNPFK